MTERETTKLLSFYIRVQVQYSASFHWNFPGNLNDIYIF